MSKRYTALATVLVMLTGCSTGSTQATSPDQSNATPAAPAQLAAPAGQAVTLSQAQVDAGSLYKMGMEAKAAGDYQAMIDQLMASAEAGNPQAHYELARLLSEGKVVVRDTQAARVYLERSAALGNPEALRVLAWNTLRGDGVPRDADKGVSMMRQAAETSTRAQRELGMLYANIYQPNLNDFDQANFYLAMAAEAGDADAAYHLGRLKEGAGDAIGAVEWYEKASVGGQEKASAALRALENGEPGVALMLVPSARHEQVALAAESPEAMFHRAMKLLSSRHTPDEEADAYALLVLASEAGYTAATQELTLQGGIKLRLDQQNPDWLAQAKQKFTPMQDSSSDGRIDQ